MPGHKQPDPYMMIRGGTKVFLNHPDPADFDTKLIAQTLAHQHRYVGNYGDYSVAQHAVNVAEITRRYLSDSGGVYLTHRDKLLVQLAALHHDDAEAVLGDIPSPVKREVKPLLKPIEVRMERALEKKHGLEEGLLDHPAIKYADLLCFIGEITWLCPPDHQEPYWTDVGYGPDEGKQWQLPASSYIPWGANEALSRYLDLHAELNERLNR